MNGISDSRPHPMARAAFLACLYLAALLCLHGPALAQPGDSAGDQPSILENGANGEQAASLPPGSYTAELRGSLDPALRTLILESLDTFTRKDSPPRTGSLLAHRMQGDVQTVRRILSSWGYFQGRVETEILDGPDRSDGTPGLPLAVFTVVPGERFRIGRVAITATPGSDPAAPLPAPGEIGVSPGDPYAAKAVVDGQEAIERHLAARGYPFPKVEDLDVRAIGAERIADVTYVVSTGPVADFGETTISGLSHVDEAYVRGRLPWIEGMPYDGSLVEETRSTLVAGGLFSVALFEKGEVTADGRVPMHLELVERRPRTIRLGLRYRTDSGPGGKAEWEHRTLFGRAERLLASVEADMITQQAGLAFRKPNFLVEPMSLLVEQRFVRERDDAFHSLTSVSSAGVEYAFTPRLVAGVGLSYRLSRIDAVEQDETYALFSVPLSLRYDGSDDLLNPTKGQRVTLSGARYFVSRGDVSDFVQSQLSATQYLSILGGDRLVLALRAQAGATSGAALSNVPKDLRLYAGGGASVRGYAYRMAGDLDDAGDPVGGRSVFETSAEVRWRFHEEFGLVGFVDAGRAFAREYPDFGRKLFMGAGFGMRYYSFVGPIGVDIAFPLDRRRGRDDRFQVYVSLGQSF